ncbi:glutamate:gamma-aminobutyrate antiporter, GGA family (TC 2.A.3.7.1) [Cetobacterium ceti]|uniref:Glutamate/gamma-aminobutyrate antiporter n=1 Tax=Cetobacterium ceti TaxID=180163 RepID=A0A1T4N7Q9_9FUSO|nr:glutamate:gamma-aminobutyrate antiporter [Cetobacterium ceti]SJZ75165.1 glutamate:gamma-aminobutyrate antiporter, GGA family (TC 2.A.3.7.1) [Cetobacterium ceti]
MSTDKVQSNNTGDSSKNLTLFGFFTITASMVMAVYEYPTFATSGFSLVFFLLFGGLFWFIPVALCAAEMATVDGWQTGGLFSWVSNTVGERWGFAAIFFQWFQITVGFITMLYFVVGALSYVFDWPALNTNPLLKFAAVIIIFWLLTFSQLGGTKYTARIAMSGFIFGILIPAAILVVLALAYVAGGNHLDIQFTSKTFFPDFTKVNSLVILVSFILSYMGVEASASHVNEMKNPGRDYPLAMFMLVIVAIVLSTIGGLSVASVVPLSELNLSSGINQTFAILITHYGKGLMWIVRIIAAAIGFGAMAEISSWVVGPSRAIYATAQKGLLPPIFKKVNKHGVPVPLVMFQGIIVTIWAAVLTLGGGGSNLSFLTAMSLTVVLYLISYMLLFVGYFILIFKHKDLKRTYHVPGGIGVKCLVAGVGLIVSILSFVISFFPPSGINSTGEYETILTVSFVVALFIPFIIYEFRNKFNHAGIDPTRITTKNAPDGHFFIHPKGRGEFHITPHENDIMNQDDVTPTAPKDDSKNK